MVSGEKIMITDPIEAMAKAHWENDVGCSDEDSWDTLDIDCQQELIRDMRAGVLALAGLELPEEVKQAGGDAIANIYRSDAEAASDGFRAMLLAIASPERGNLIQATAHE